MRWRRSARNSEAAAGTRTSGLARFSKALLRNPEGAAGGAVHGRDSAGSEMNSRNKRPS